MPALVRPVLGIDVGTTAVKCLALDPEAGTYMAVRSDPYALRNREPGWAEEEPDDWVRAIDQAMHRLRAQGVELGHIEALAVSGMVPATIVLDEEGAPLRPSIQQSDGRTGSELRAIAGSWPLDAIYAATGSALNQQHVLPKLLWIRAHEEAVWSRIRRVVGSYDYIRSWLTGTYAVEVNWAIESGMYDVRVGRWLDDYLGAFGVPLEWLPQPAEPLAVAGPLVAAAAARLGLRSGIPVIVGSADHVASALAAGVEGTGDLLIKFGGAGDILYCTERAVFHPKLYFDRHDLPDRYLLNGCMATSGSLVRWLLAETGHDEGDLAALDRAACQVAPGSDGLVVLPYFLGEKTPLLDPAARGVFFGLMLHHGAAHLFRSVLESVVYGFRHHVDVLEEAGHPIGRLFSTDGGARSALWQQIAADALGRDVVAYPDHPGSALGAAIVAAMGVGRFPNRPVSEVIATNREVYHPRDGHHRAYDVGYSLYRDLYERTRPLLAASAELAEKGRVAHGA